jgi:hypothetical protein
MDSQNFVAEDAWVVIIVCIFQGRIVSIIN